MAGRQVDKVILFPAKRGSKCGKKDKKEAPDAADALSYKLRGYAITGLVYKALPMGAVPVGHESIIDLKDVPCEEIEINETNAYHFVLTSAIDFPTLSADDQQILDKVIQRFGMMKKEDLVEFMHQEKAYKKTDLWDVISFEYAAYLQI